MKPPTGFVPLCEAVYTVGKRLHGLNWHPIGKCSDRRLFDHEVEIVIAVIAKACEAGQITAAYRSITGADALDRPVTVQAERWTEAPFGRCHRPRARGRGEPVWIDKAEGCAGRYL
jgi:hypothetical protein